MTVASPGNYDLTVYQGATFDLTFTWYQADGVTPVNLSGYTGSCKIAAGKGGAVLLDCSSMLTLGGALGTIRLLISAANTATLTQLTPPASWDLKLTDGSGVATRLLQGIVIIDKAVS